MARKALRICCACGKEYNYCPYCSDDELKPKWMLAFHDETCKEVFDTVSKYYSNSISLEDAHARLKDRITEKDIPNYTEDIQVALRKIFASVKVEEAPKTTKPASVKRKVMKVD